MNKRIILNTLVFFAALALSYHFLNFFFVENLNYFKHGKCGGGKGCFNRVMALFLLLVPAQIITYSIDYFVFKGRSFKHLFAHALLPATFFIVIISLQKLATESSRNSDISFGLLPFVFFLIWAGVAKKMNVLSSQV